MEEELRGYLIAVAQHRATTTYAEAARAAGLSVDDPRDRERLAALLRAISTAEHAAGRPLLTAVVVLQGRGRPGRGFFDLARSLGLETGPDDAEYFAGELARVHQQWTATEHQVLDHKGTKETQRSQRGTERRWGDVGDEGDG